MGSLHQACGLGQDFKAVKQLEGGWCSRFPQDRQGFARSTAERGLWAEDQQCKGSETGNCMEGEPCERWRTAWRGHPEFTPRGGERGNGGVWGEANEDQVEAPVDVKTK